MIATLRIFWLWWRDQLLDLLPGYVERRRSRADDGLIVSGFDGAEPDAPASVLVTERRAGVERPASRVRLDPEVTEPVRAGAARLRLPIVLRLPGHLLLEREVTLPIAAEAELGRVLFHEMDRFTPFDAREVIWTHALTARDRAQGRLTARLSLVQKPLAAPLLDALGRAGLPVACLELPAATGEWRRIFLDEGERTAGPASNRLLRPALTTIAVLLLLAVALPFILQEQARAQVERQIALATPLVAQVKQLRSAAAAGATGSEVIAAERRRAGVVLEAIALLTDALPDDTYLSALTYDAGKLTLDGQSKSAAALIAPLTANRRLQDASFTAPVVRNTLGTDSFSLRVRVTR